MAKEIENAFADITGELNDKSFNASNYLASVGTEEVVLKLIELFKSNDTEARLIAARTLGLIKKNELALPLMLEALKEPENASILGELLMALEGFDISDSYVEIFKHYLFGSFKVSRVATDLL
ncbi:MAG: HEAT repeat protein, partial [Roseivirga sp.]